MSESTNSEKGSRTRRWPRVLLVILVLLACGVGYVAALLSLNLDHGAALPGVELTQLEGGAFDLASLQGKVVLLDFWAST